MKKYSIYFYGLLVLLISCIVAPPVLSQTIPDRPIASTVLDETGLLSLETIQTLDALNQEWASTEQALQVGVYLTDSLSSDIESLANATFRHWQIGFSGSDHGVLLLIAINDRQFRIETSDKAAIFLPDVEAKRILDNARDFFRAEDYDAGITYIVQAIGDRFYGTNTGQERLTAFEEWQDEEESVSIVFLLVIIIVVLLLIGTSGRGGGGPSNLLWMLVDSGVNHNHHSSDSSTYGGGSWSGGGGGGGGASSGW